MPHCKNLEENQIWQELGAGRGFYPGLRRISANVSRIKLGPIGVSSKLRPAGCGGLVDLPRLQLEGKG